MRSLNSPRTPAVAGQAPAQRLDEGDGRDHEYVSGVMASVTSLPAVFADPMTRP
jgi:hypothetical protein